MKGREFLEKLQSCPSDWRVLICETASLHELASIGLHEKSDLEVKTVDGRRWSLEVRGNASLADTRYLWLELRDMDENGRMVLAYHDDVKIDSGAEKIKLPAVDRIVMVFFNKKIDNLLRVAEEEQKRVVDEIFTRDLCG